MGIDKLYHFVAGWAISVFAFVLAFLVGAPLVPAALGGVAVAALVGGLKEAWDGLGHGVQDSVDFWFTALGGAVAAIIIVLLS